MNVITNRVKEQKWWCLYYYELNYDCKRLKGRKSYSIFFHFLLFKEKLLVFYENLILLFFVWKLICEFNAKILLFKEKEKKGKQFRDDKNQKFS